MSKSITEIINRLQQRTAALAPDSPVLKEALTRVGLYVSSLAKIEARRKGIISTGRLVNSLRYEFFRKGSVVGVSIGSFNVPYAAMNEFGGRVTPRQYRAMMARMGKSGVVRRKGKGVVTGSPEKGGYWRARPYLRPAFTRGRPFIVDTIRAALSFAQKGGI